MAEIPTTYGRRPIPDGRRPIVSNDPGILAGALGDVGGQLGQMAKIADVEAQKEDAARAADSDAALAGQIREYMYNPESGFLNKQKFDAVRGRDEALQALKGMQEGALQGLSKGAAARLRGSLDGRISSAMQSVDVHVSGQREAWLNAAAQARMEAAANDALVAFGADDTVQENLAVGVAEIRNKAAREGWSKEQTDVAVLGYESSTLRAVVLRRAEADPVGAMEWAKSNAGKMTGADMAYIDSVVGSAAKEFEGRAWAQRAVTAAGPFDLDSYLGRMFHVESAGNPAAQNENTSAGGIAQFTNGTWIGTVQRHAPGAVKDKTEAEILAMKTDTSPAGVAFQKQMARALTTDNILLLQQAGLPVDNGSVYMAHFFGGGGATKILKDIAANGGTTPVIDIIGSEAVEKNPQLNGLTAAQARDWAYKYVGQEQKSPIRAAADIADPVTRDAAIKQIAFLERMQAAEAQAVVSAARQQLWEYVEQGGDPAKVPAEVRHAAGVETVSALERYHANKAAGDAPFSDPVVYRDMVLMAETDPAAFAKENILAVRDKLTDADYKMLTDKQAKIAGGEPDRTSFGSAFDMADRVWRSHGIVAGQDGSQQAIDYARMQVDLMREITAVEASGKKASPADIMSIAGALAVASPSRRVPQAPRSGLSPSVLRSAAQPEVKALGLNDKQEAAFHRAHQMAAQAYVAATGQEPTGIQQAEMAQVLLSKVEMDSASMWGFGDKFVYEITRQDLENVANGTDAMRMEGFMVEVYNVDDAHRFLFTGVDVPSQGFRLVAR